MAANEQALLFDLDGTIVHVESSYINHTLDRVGEELEVEFSKQEAERIWYGREGLRDDILASYGIEPDRFWHTFHRIETPEERLAATRLHDDAYIIPTISIPKAIVTHCQPYLAEPILDQLGIRDWFDAVVCCSDDLGWKPDPAPVYRAIDALGLDRPQASLIGDSVADIGAANNAGIESVLISRNGTTPRANARRIVRSLTELQTGY